MNRFRKTGISRMKINAKRLGCRVLFFFVALLKSVVHSLINWKYKNSNRVLIRVASKL
jgi:hypothetical protein